MNKYKLHQWLPLLLLLVIQLTSCSRKNLPGTNAGMQEQYQNEVSGNTVTLPVAVISIPDELSKANKEGEMYYDNAAGYRYWRFCDGRYYLDTKYEYGSKPYKKTSKKKGMQQTKKSRMDLAENGYSNQ